MQKEEVKEILLQAVAGQVQEEVGGKITLNSEIIPLGIHSLSFIQIIVELEDKCGIDFDDDSLDFYGYHTLEDVYNYVLNMLSIEN